MAITCIYSFHSKLADKQSIDKGVQAEEKKISGKTCTHCPTCTVLNELIFLRDNESHEYLHDILCPHFLHFVNTTNFWWLNSTSHTIKMKPVTFYAATNLFRWNFIQQPKTMSLFVTKLWFLLRIFCFALGGKQMINSFLRRRISENFSVCFYAK